MGEQDWLAQRFEDNRTHLTAVAYRMLGSFSEADDAVQESWLRLSRSGASGVENLGGWLTTVVARVCLDMLRSRKARREEPLGTHQPEPVAGHLDGTDPEHQVVMADSIGSALLVVLQPLACPSKRSLQSWIAPQPRPGSSPAAHVAGSRVHLRLPIPIEFVSEKLWTPSSPLRGVVSSTRFSRCSTRALYCEPTGPRSRPEHQARSAVPGPLPPPSRGVREPPNRRSSTEPPASYGLQVEGRAWSSPSRLRTGGSSRSISSPTGSEFADWMCPSWTASEIEPATMDHGQHTNGGPARRRAGRLEGQ